MREKQPLTEHEQKIQELLLETLADVVQGFPTSERGLDNVTRAWASFISLEPHKVKFLPQIEPYMSQEDKDRFAWKEGIIPGEWLMGKIRDGFEWMPAPVVAREIYCESFEPRDGKTMDMIGSIGRRRPAREDE